MAEVSNASSGQNQLDILAEEFLERQRKGERPSIEEYAAKYPLLAEQIRDLFHTLQMLEQVRPQEGQTPSEFTRSHLEGESAAGSKDSQFFTRPEKLGDYRILRQVGKGGMGIVYEAVQEALGRHVALKVLPPKQANDSSSLERFRREARSAAKLHHTNIVPVHDVGMMKDAQGTTFHYYAMQFIYGQPLDLVLKEVQRLRSNAPPTRFASEGEEKPSNIAASIAAANMAKSLMGQTESFVQKPDEVEATETSQATSRNREEPKNASLLFHPTESLAHQPEDRYLRAIARLGIQAAQGLAYAHAQGVLHRDVKPSNLLLDAQGTLWLADFGLAKMEQDENLTTAGALVGTLRYMPPERIKGEGDHRADIYSLGATLYELVTLRPLFLTTNKVQLIDEISTLTPPRPRSLDKRIPSDLETIILKAIARDPADRYSSADELAEDLERYLNDQPIKARRHSPVELVWRWCRRNPTVASLSAGLATTLLLGIGVSTSFGLIADKERAAAVKAEGQAKEDRNKAERNLIGSFLRPLGYKSGEYEPAELNGMKELSELEDGRLKMMFLEEVLNDPAVAERFLRKSELAVQAAIGTSMKRRKAALEMAVAKQKDMTADPRCRAAAVWMCLELYGGEVPGLGEAVETIVGKKLLDQVDLARLVMHIPAARIPPLTDYLIVRLESEKDAYELGIVGEVLEKCFESMESSVAQPKLRNVCLARIAHLEREINSELLRAAVRTFEKLMAKLDSEAAQHIIQKGCDVLTAILEREKKEEILRDAGDALVACVKKVEASNTQLKLIAWFTSTLSVIKREKRIQSLRAANAAVALCVAKLEHAIAQQIIQKGCESLVAIFEKEKHPYQLLAAAEAFEVCVKKLEPAMNQAMLRKWSLFFITFVGREKDEGNQRAASQALTACLTKLEPAASQQMLQQACTALLANFESGREENYRQVLGAGEALVICVGKLDSGIGQPILQKGCAALVDILLNEKNHIRLRSATNALEKCAAKLDPATSQPLYRNGCIALLAILEREKDYWQIRDAGDALAVCATKLETNDGHEMIRKGCSILISRIEQEKDAGLIRAASKALVVCSAKLAAPNEQMVIRNICANLISILEKDRDEDRIYSAGEALAVCAEKLEAGAFQSLLQRGIATLLFIVERGKGSNQQNAAVEALSVCVSKLNAANAKSVTLKGCADLVTMLETGDVNTANYARKAISELLPYVNIDHDTFEVTSLLKRLVARCWTANEEERLYHTILCLARIHQRIADHSSGKVNEIQEAIFHRSLALFHMVNLFPADRFTAETGLFLNEICSAKSNSENFISCFKNHCCIAHVRVSFLRRLEELCFPPTSKDWQAETALRSLDISAGSFAFSQFAGIHAAGSIVKSRVQPRFKNQWEAIEWIDKHHPGIDWDAPYKPLKQPTASGK